jgi:hypothetical protein
VTEVWQRRRRNLSQPVDDARVRAILEALRRSSFLDGATEISHRWQGGAAPDRQAVTVEDRAFDGNMVAQDGARLGLYALPLARVRERQSGLRIK